MIQHSTPIEVHQRAFVKRDDLCCDSPRMAKVRGLDLFVKKRPEISCFGIMDGNHSRNGWALARVNRDRETETVVFYPRYKRDEGLPLEETEGASRREARALGATIVPLQATRTSVMFARARRWLEENRSDESWCLVPNAVKIPETVEAIAREVVSQSDVWNTLKPRTLVLPCGSGTIASGVMEGFCRLGMFPEVCLVMSYGGNVERLRRYVESLTSFPLGKVRIVESSDPYGVPGSGEAPFPACEFYELKAWNYLRSRSDVKRPIVFWNAGD